MSVSAAMRSFCPLGAAMATSDHIFYNQNHKSPLNFTILDSQSPHTLPSFWLKLPQPHRAVPRRAWREPVVP